VIDQWIYFIKNAENLELIPENINDEGLKIAYQDADKHSWSKADLDAYDKIFMREQDDRGRITVVQKDIARKLIKRNRPIEEISEDTGLTMEQIEILKQENE
jgi:hypothetical protein